MDFDLITFSTIAAGILVVAVGSAVIKRDKAKALSERLKTEFRLDEVHVSADDFTLIGLNLSDRQILLGSGEQRQSYRFSDISSVGVVQNDATLAETHRGSQILGATVGGMAFGGVGALIGGLSGSSRSRTRIRRMSLKVTIDDSTCPVYMICFFSWPTKDGLDPDHRLCQSARSAMERFHAHLLNAIRATSKTPDPGTQVYVAEELQRLWNLKEAGILSENEFLAQKARLLNR